MYTFEHICANSTSKHKSKSLMLHESKAIPRPTGAHNTSKKYVVMHSQTLFGDERVLAEVYVLPRGIEYELFTCLCLSSFRQLVCQPSNNNNNNTFGGTLPNTSENMCGIHLQSISTFRRIAVHTYIYIYINLYL